MQYQVKNGSFQGNLIHAVILIVPIGFLIAAFASGESITGNPKGDNFLYFVGFIMAICVVFYPVLVSLDIADKIEPIAQHNKKMEEEKRKDEIIKIPHPKRGIIFGLTLFSFFTVGILWIIALWIASGEVNVLIPDDVATKVGLKKPEGSTNSATELLSLKSLLDDGVISQEEFQAKKIELGFTDEGKT
jgi:hypothetical protein